MSDQENNSSNGNMDSTNLLVFMFKWRWQLIAICFAAAIISAIASFVIEEKFKSNVVMFAATQHSIGEQFYEETKKNDLLEFGEKEDAERLLQILNSDRIRSKIITRFDLWAHYEIEPSVAGANTLMQKEYESNVSARMTRFGSIEIEVLDKNNEKARDMANAIAFLVDSVANEIRNNRAMDAFKYAEESLTQVKNEITTMEDSLGVLHNLGVFDYATQIEGLNEQYGTAIVKGEPSRAQQIKEQMENISLYANAFNKLTTLLEAAYDREAILKKRYDLMKIDATSQLSSTFVVDYAAASDKKAYPVRWLIVAMSTASAFVFSVIIILLVENIRRLKLTGEIS
jgi:LPS O-antigen subunit length determinant protein (WzzB/FepE family)